MPSNITDNKIRMASMKPEDMRLKLDTDIYGIEDIHAGDGWIRALKVLVNKSSELPVNPSRKVKL